MRRDDPVYRTRNALALLDAAAAILEETQPQLAKALAPIADVIEEALEAHDRHRLEEAAEGIPVAELLLRH